MREAYFIHPAAQEELHQAMIYYANLDEMGDLELAFFNTFADCLRSVLAYPLSYQVRRLGIRRANFKPCFVEYYIAYTIRHDKVVILAVGHAQRRPYYWQVRSSEAIKADDLPINERSKLLEDIKKGIHSAPLPRRPNSKPLSAYPKRRPGEHGVFS